MRVRALLKIAILQQLTAVMGPKSLDFSLFFEYAVLGTKFRTVSE